jgi:hypothetical protein
MLCWFLRVLYEDEAEERSQDRKDGDDYKQLYEGEGLACVHGIRLLVKEYITVFHICQPLAHRPVILAFAPRLMV